MIDEAIRSMQDRFPFSGYVDDLHDTYRGIGQTVLEYLPKGARILDIGAGPCDKTAVLQNLGYLCTAIDDLQDPWHLKNNNRDKILRFAEETGIDYYVSDGTGLPFEQESFDAVMLLHVLEHLHESPRDLLNEALKMVKPLGYLIITVPSAVNLRKRLHVLMGKSNMPPFSQYYWWSGPWRGHIREYTRGDLSALVQLQGLEVVKLEGCHNMTHKLPRKVRSIYLAVTNILKDCRDSWLLVARKPFDWQPKQLPEVAESFTD